MEVTDNWVAEFFIRRQKNPRISPTTLLSALKFVNSADSLYLKTASVLRDISDSLIFGNVAEGTLDLLETLEKLQGSGVVITESHKSAYCWTAAECTVRLMWPVSASEGLYSDALERIWRKRIRVLKESGSGLVSEELLKWEDDLKKGGEDPEVYNRVREINVRYKAVSFLTQLLKEQWGVLGCSSLESVAQRRLLKRKAVGEISRGLEDDEAEEERRMVARELKEYLLEIQRRIHPCSANNESITPPQPSRVVNRTGTSGLDDASSSRVRPRLPTPVPLKVSPLKKATRRQKKFWTPEEEAALREGVKEHGKSWKHIKNANPELFAGRTEVDLKDKWRNLVR